jgi:hypothetical protein
MKRQARHVQIMTKMKLLTSQRQQTQDQKKLKELNRQITTLTKELNKL